jgi:hypothetical protein
MKTRIPVLFRSRSLMTALKLPMAFSIALEISDVAVNPTTMFVKLLITTILVWVSLASLDISSVRLVNFVQ